MINDNYNIEPNASGMCNAQIQTNHITQLRTSLNTQPMKEAVQYCNSCNYQSVTNNQECSKQHIKPGKLVFFVRFFFWGGGNEQMRGSGLHY